MSFETESKGKEVVYITSLLSIFGVVEIQQMRKMFSNVRSVDYGHILYRLQKEGMVYIDKKMRYLSTCRYAMDKSQIPYSIRTFWALIKVKDKVDSFCAGSEPVMLTFLSDESEYDLIPVTETNRDLIEEGMKNTPEKVRRILVVSSLSEVDDMVFRDENDFVIVVEDDGSATIYRMEGG